MILHIRFRVANPNAKNICMIGYFFICSLANTLKSLLGMYKGCVPVNYRESNIRKMVK